MLEFIRTIYSWCESSGFHSSEERIRDFLGCSAVQFIGQIPMLRTTALPPSSGRWRGPPNVGIQPPYYTAQQLKKPKLLTHLHGIRFEPLYS